jgi:hypothetical protein
MIQGRAGPRLLLEAPEPIGIAGKYRGQELDGDRAAKHRIAGEVHLTHAARTQLRLNLVTT